MLKPHHAVLSLALLLALLGDSWGQSQRPSPGHRNSDRQTQTQPKSSQNPTPDDKRVTEQSPVVVKVIGAEPKTQDGTANNPDNNQEKPRDWWTIWPTVALIGVGFLQLAAFIVQARRLGQTFHVMKDTAERQLRAYVFVYNGHVSIVTMGVTKTLAYKLNIELRNFGQTPARKYTTWIEHAIRNVDDLPFTQPPPLDKRSAHTIMGPTASATIEFATPFEVSELDDVRAAKKAIFVWGGCDYVDVFGRERYFIFRFKISGHENQGLWRLRPHEIGEEGN